MSGGLQAAIRAAAARKGQPTEVDVPPPSTFPGQERKPLPGQFDLFGGEIPMVEPEEHGHDELEVW